MTPDGTAFIGCTVNGFAQSDDSDPARLVQGYDEAADNGATHRQVADTFSVICRGVDPSPVPSFRTVADDERALQLAAAQTDVDTEAKGTLLDCVSDALGEASVPNVYKGASCSLAVDSTDLETLEPAPAGRGSPDE